MQGKKITAGVSEPAKAIRRGSPSELETPNLIREQILSIMLEDDEEAERSTLTKKPASYTPT